MPGRFVNGLASWSCEACPPGTANPDFKKTACVECLPGSFSEVTDELKEKKVGNVERSLCEEGHYQSGPRQSKCLACAKGFSTNVKGSIECKRFEEGYFASQLGTKVFALHDPSDFLCVS